MDEKTEQNLAYGPFLKLRNKGGTAPAVDVPPATAATDVGPLLCAARMRLGKDLQAIAGLLHIRYTYLVAIEDGRFEDLPGQAYAIGFVRAYAEHLGLDGDEIVRRYKEENAGVRRKASLDFPLPAPESGVPSGLLLVVAVVMGMVVYAVWYSIAGADRRAAALIQEIPDRLAALIGTTRPAPQSEPDNVAASEPTVTYSPDEADSDTPLSRDVIETAAATVAEAVPEPARVKPEPAVAPVTPANVAAPAPAVSETPKIAAAVKETPPAPAPEPAPPVKVAVAPIAEPPAPKPTPPQVEPAKEVVKEIATEPPKVALAEPIKEPVKETQTASLPTPPKPPSAPVKPAAEAKPVAEPAAKAKPGADTVELRATSDSWIQVRAGDELLLTRLLRKGEIYRVPDRTGLTLMTGNAGGVEVLVNGTAMPPLGDEGAVARGVPLEAQRLKTMAKAAAPTIPAAAQAD